MRCLLTIATARNWFTHKIDVQNAFLHGTLHEIIYMDLSPGHHRQGENDSTNPFMVDYSLFIRQNNSSFTALSIYVDDILLIGNDLTEIQRVKDCLLQQFRIKDLGDLKYFLGIEFSRSKAGIYMSQRKYALDILQDTGQVLVQKNFQWSNT